MASYIGSSMLEEYFICIWNILIRKIMRTNILIAGKAEEIIADEGKVLT